MIANILNKILYSLISSGAIYINIIFRGKYSLVFKGHYI